jgi:hypothetical protein
MHAHELVSPCCHHVLAAVRRPGHLHIPGVKGKAKAKLIAQVLRGHHPCKCCFASLIEQLQQQSLIPSPDTVTCRCCSMPRYVAASLIDGWLLVRALYTASRSP